MPFGPRAESADLAEKVQRMKRLDFRPPFARSMENIKLMATLEEGKDTHFFSWMQWKGDVHFPYLVEEKDEK